MGKPVIASAINGIPEYVDNGVDGLLFEPGNAEQLARCIDRLSADTSMLSHYGQERSPESRGSFRLSGILADFGASSRRAGFEATTDRSQSDQSRD